MFTWLRACFAPKSPAVRRFGARVIGFCLVHAAMLIAVAWTFKHGHAPGGR
ncbi:MAG TPA: hypothetical protein PLW65_23640 [Pseudomonadota bacterium]|nr:hypothetical protein [Pseudomonadota bacterium]